MTSKIKGFQGKVPVIGQRVYVDNSAVIIGDVQIGDDSSIWPTAVIRGDMHSIIIGARTSIQDGSVLHITHKSHYNPAGYPLDIGSEVTIGHKAVLHGCTIQDRCLIGIGAIVMDGAVVEEEVMVAAGCLVPPGKHLKSGHLYKGNPAKIARPLSEKERQYLRYSADNYVKLKDQYLETVS
ncbi:gamma carbonic anhydrase family protein [Endozoicomonas sp. Mp262]|uniref:gamma carbonic anhydrase family protein n=1 Tax=Endozoicomonas sp. Mp262 TaxID=2919499 RepID=UPI0021DA1C3F